MLRVADQTARLPAVDRQRALASSAQPLRDRGTLLMLEGPAAGKVFGLTGGDLLFGRGAECSARIQDAGLSRRHARIFRVEDQFFIEDLGSTNGTYVNGRRLEGVLDLEGHDRIRMGCDVLLRFDPHDSSEQETVSGLYESSVRDPLTMAYNRRHLHVRLEEEVSYALRHELPLTVILIDVDHFKAVNDRHGHHAGDLLLRVLAALLQRISRPEDLVARYGGEEFCVVARATDAERGLALAERLRQSVAQLTVPWDDEKLSITVSLGVATAAGGYGGDGDALLTAADIALYSAKAAGRNRASAADEAVLPRRKTSSGVRRRTARS